MVTPLPHQLAGGHYLAEHELAYLTDPPGLGKTGTTIKALDMLGATKVAVVVPAIVRHHWAREDAAFSPAGRIVVTATTPSWRQTTGDMFVFSYAQLIQPATLAWLRSRRWDVLICDEAHALANPRAKLTRCICGDTMSRRDGVAGTAEHVWFLSGTPMRHHAHSLWTAARVLTGTRMRYLDWIARYCITRITPFGEQVIGTRMDRVDELRALFGPFMLRRKQALIGLKKLRFGKIVLGSDTGLSRELKALLTPEREARLLRLMEQGAAWEREGGEEAVAIATLRRLVGEAKAGPTALLVEALFDEGVGAVVVFAHHKSVIASLRERLAAHQPLVLDGGTGIEARRVIVENFQQHDGPKVLICSITVAGTGITLTRASRAILVEPSFSPVDNEQAAKRLHRLGQREPVLVSVVGLAGTFDERIAEIAQRKADAQGAFSEETAA